jgi:NADP-dependent 3-hydroxy acid dehydrogenase YdfG
MDLSDNITGKIIVITGASSGLGETTARHLASKANVVLGARREDKLEQIATEINSTGKGKPFT